MRRILQVEPSTGDPYPVYCGSDLSQVWQPRWRRAVLIADRNTDRLFGDVIRKALPPGSLTQVVSAGESSKSRNVKARIEDEMLAAGIDRDGCIVALGGGVVLDLAGFVAATYLRGIDHVMVATSLLAQVDAAIGGKTAVNVPQGKNLIGVFHHPRAVLLHLEALAQLPDVELRNGLAELIKHAVIGDADLFASLEQWVAQAAGLGPPPIECIERSVRFKAAVVAEDGLDRGINPSVWMEIGAAGNTDLFRNPNIVESVLHGAVHDAVLVVSRQVPLPDYTRCIAAFLEHLRQDDKVGIQAIPGILR